MSQRWLWGLAGIIVGLALLWLAGRSISYEEVVSLTRQAHPGYVVLTLAMSVTFIMAKTLRWVALLRPIARVHFIDLLRPVYAGTAINLLLSHVGEIVRARMLQTSYRVPMSTVLASIGIERTLDMLVVAAMLGGLFIFGAGATNSHLIVAFRITGILIAVAVAIIATAVFFPASFRKTFNKMLAFFPANAQQWFDRQLDGVLRGFDSIQQPSILFKAIVLSFVQWGIIALGVRFAAESVGIQADFLVSITVLALMIVGLTLPTAPAYLGTTQAAFVVGLSTVNVSDIVAFAASAIYTIFLVLPQLIIGLLCLFSGRKSVLTQHEVRYDS